ncbi:MAG: hypothetical protein OXH97_05775 [Chloroflexota bacterium]|nr:hypothetical protein [Chloroflexota bacterium]
MSEHEPAKRRYRREMLLALLAYGVLLVASTFVVAASPGAWWRYAVAVLPMVPAAFMVVAAVRHYRAMDELQQRMELEALAFGFAGTALITFTYGFLEQAGMPQLSWWWVWPIMAGLWILGGQLARRRWL